MGWTYLHKDKGVSTKDFFVQEFNYINESGSGEVLDVKTKANVAYIAYKRTKVTGEVFVTALVCLIGRKPKDYYNFGYKDMDETMMPYYYDCPKSILQMLTETDNKNALEWRALCQSQVKKAAKISIKYMDTIEFKEEISFGKFGRSKVFTRISEKKNHYSSTEVSVIVRLSKQFLSKHEFTIKGK